MFPSRLDILIFLIAGIRGLWATNGRRPRTGPNLKAAWLLRLPGAVIHFGTGFFRNAAAAPGVLSSRAEEATLPYTVIVASRIRPGVPLEFCLLRIKFPELNNIVLVQSHNLFYRRFPRVLWIQSYVLVRLLSGIHYFKSCIGSYRCYLFSRIANDYIRIFYLGCRIHNRIGTVCIKLEIEGRISKVRLTLELNLLVIVLFHRLYDRTCHRDQVLWFHIGHFFQFLTTLH